MKFSEWLEPETVAILCTAIYYGVPKEGHLTCYKEMATSHHPSHMQIADHPSLEGLHCISCGKPLLLSLETVGP